MAYQQKFHLDSILPPTRCFAIGEPVEYGYTTASFVTAILEGGKLYEIEVTHKERDGERMFANVVPWYALNKKGLSEEAAETERFSRPDDIRCRASNMDVGGMLSRIESAGVDFNPPYQRGHVWPLEAKQKLIETMLARGSIGTLAFNRRDFGFDGPLYEVVDGKQRLTAINEYMQDQFAYRGRVFSQLNPADRILVRRTPVLVYDLEEAGEAEILKLFLRVNREGTPVDEKHIEFVRKRLAGIEAAKNPEVLAGRKNEFRQPQRGRSKCH